MRRPSLRGLTRPPRVATVAVWGWFGRVRRSAHARPVRAVRISAGVLAALAVLAGLLWYQTERYAQLDSARTEAVAAADEAVVQLTSYSFRSLDRHVEQTRDLVTGVFAGEYAAFVTGSVAPTATDRQIVVRTLVLTSSVIDSAPDEVELLMTIEQQSEAKLNPGIETALTDLRVSMEKHDGRWLVSKLTPL